MARAEIDAGICGFKTTVEARKNGDGTVHLEIESDCSAVCKLAEQFQDVEPYREVFWRGISTVSIRARDASAWRWSLKPPSA